MQPFPDRYEVSAGATVTGDVTLESERLPALKSAAPAGFGGPGDRWSPETLLVGAVADCFMLTFRAIAGMSQLPWTSLRCEAVGDPRNGLWIVPPTTLHRLSSCTRTIKSK